MAFLQLGHHVVSAPSRPGTFADINVMQVFGARDVTGFDQRLDGRGRQMRELVRGVETRKMQGPVRPKFLMALPYMFSER